MDWTLWSDYTFHKIHIILNTLRIFIEIEFRALKEANE
jgi:hypothetical protein